MKPKALLFCLASAMAFATTAGAEKFKMAAKLEPGQFKLIVAELKATKRPATVLQSYIPYFQVGAIKDTKIICRLTPQGLECHEATVVRGCPDTITLIVEGSSQPVDVPIDCEGPTSDIAGNATCECDFASPEG